MFHPISGDIHGYSVSLFMDIPCIKLGIAKFPWLLPSARPNLGQPHGVPDAEPDKVFSWFYHFTIQNQQFKHQRIGDNYMEYY